MMLRVVGAKDGIQDGEYYIQAIVSGDGGPFGRSKISVRYRGRSLERIIAQLRGEGVKIPFRTPLPPSGNFYKALAALMRGRTIDAPVSGG
jgi:hypothetical protein